MNQSACDIVRLFSSSVTSWTEKETCDFLEGVYCVKDIYVTNDDVCCKVNPRDRFSISFITDDEDDSIDFLSTNGDWNGFVTELQQKSGASGKLTIKISKYIADNHLSVYNYEAFTKYIQELSLPQFLSVIDSRLNNVIYFEVQRNDFHEWMTDTIAFVHKQSDIQLSGINVNREKRVSICRNLCYSELDRYRVLPNDLYCSQVDNLSDLQIAFRKAYIVYAFSFISDFSSIKDNSYSYKLNGFKTLTENILVDKLSKIPVDINAQEKINEIYLWLYSGGSNNDKINIARNIISLNIESLSLRINDSAFSSIISNYKIFEKENVKQYLEVRNKLSSLLIDLQSRIAGIVESFVGDFKKNIITLVSFFISVIAIRVVSKGDFINGFTNEIIGLSIIFLLISIGLLFYSRWEFSQKVRLYNKHYDQIKKRYEDVLSEIELEDIFEECDPQKEDTNRHFVNCQKKLYTRLWVASIVILFAFLIIVYIINNNISICQFCDNVMSVFKALFNFIKQTIFILCCILNISH